MKLLKPILLVTVVAFMLGGCSKQPGLIEDKSYDRTKTGALAGMVTGAIIGYTTKGKHKVGRAAIGGLAGATIGGGVGYMLDKQANEIANALGTGVDNDPLIALDPSRDVIVSKTDTYVKIMFRDQMMFATNSSNLHSRVKVKVAKVAQLLRNYPHTVVSVAGFTDNRGSYDYNLNLSQRRAEAVSSMLAVNSSVLTQGCSYNKAIALNDTAKNRALNRRVEVYLYADKTMISDSCL